MPTPVIIVGIVTPVAITPTLLAPDLEPDGLVIHSDWVVRTNTLGRGGSTGRPSSPLLRRSFPGGFSLAFVLQIVVAVRIAKLLSDKMALAVVENREIVPVVDTSPSLSFHFFSLESALWCGCQ